MTKLFSERLFKFPQPLKLGEGPIYRFEDSTLHYVDFESKEVHILPLNPDTLTKDENRELRVLKTEEPITCLYFQADKPGYICLYFDGIGELDEETGKLTKLKEICDPKKCRLNDGCVDPKGRLWLGELDYETGNGPLSYTHTPIGRFFQYTKDGTLTTVIPDNIAISNGIAFSPDYKKFFYNDSKAQYTYVFDFDVEAGKISNQRVLHDFRGTTDEPDGLVSDVDGNVWSALYNGHAVVKIDGNTGEILERVEIPAKAVTCPAWGGANNDTLLITTGAGSGSDHDGHLYKIKTDTKGMPNFKFGQK